MVAKKLISALSLTIYNRIHKLARPTQSPVGYGWPEIVYYCWPEVIGSVVGVLLVRIGFIGVILWPEMWSVFYVSITQFGSHREHGSL